MYQATYHKSVIGTALARSRRR